ncbi:MAG: glycerol-3-phosphate acyltransferase [Dehalococcoidales bacterium]|nr:glycerol-3-phosphate acyltransferase [Dehalococcoidales bacterium]
MVLREIAALVIAYLLGSIPTAYIVTRIIKGKDIRRLGGGNVGSLNTIKSVGRLPGAAVGFIDICKGAAAVLLAFYVLGVPPLFVMLAGLLSIVGHMWMIFLKFTGGRGMGPMMGSIITILCLYTDWWGLGIFLFIIAIPIFITRNVPLSLTLGIIALPIIVWFTTYSALGTIMAVANGLLTGGKFLPTGLKDLKVWQARRKALK